jgi:uncharacterized protein (UPF0332 family)
MTVNKKNRDIIVDYRLQKAKDTLTEVKGNVEMGFWHTAANRLYYACYYAVTALLIKNGYAIHTHHGVFTLLGKHFVVTGIVSKEQNQFYRRVLELRQSGDYSDTIVVGEENIAPLLEPAQQFITAIENLIKDEHANF